MKTEYKVLISFGAVIACCILSSVLSTVCEKHPAPNKPDIDNKQPLTFNEPKQEQEKKKEESPKPQKKEEIKKNIEKKDKTVYITKSGSKYHRAGCQYLKKSSIPISLSEAKSRGYSP